MKASLAVFASLLVFAAIFAFARTGHAFQADVGSAAAVDAASSASALKGGPGWNVAAALWLVALFVVCPRFVRPA